MHIDRPKGHFETLAGTLPRFRVVSERAPPAVRGSFRLCGSASRAVASTRSG
jgi:hypothetical protein